MDTPFPCSTDQKKQLAGRLGAIYAHEMQADINRVTVAVRELGEGAVWRCGAGDPRPAGLLMYDIRQGRSAQQRSDLARLLIEACREIFGFREDNLNLEFTQHRGDEMYHPMLGGLSDDWQADEASS